MKPRTVASIEGQVPVGESPSSAENQKDVIRKVERDALYSDVD